MVRNSRSAAVSAVTTMPFRFSAAAGSSAVRPRSATVDARRAFVTAGSALAVPPRKVSALPAYSGTTSMRPSWRAGSTTSRVPIAGSLSTRNPSASNAPA